MNYGPSLSPDEAMGPGGVVESSGPGHAHVVDGCPVANGRGELFIGLRDRNILITSLFLGGPCSESGF
jgi:hypothetical protein